MNQFPQTTVPTAAAAPAVSPPPYGTSPITISCHGRIRVDSDAPGGYGYISRFVNDNGHHVITESPLEALKIQILPSRGPQNALAVNSSTSYAWLGIKYNVVKGPRLAAMVTTEGRNATGAARSSSMRYTGESRSAVWNIFLDGSVTVTVPISDNSTTFTCWEPAIRLSDGLIHFFKDTDSMATLRSQGQDWTRARLRFESI